MIRKKILFYKRFLQLSLLINGFFIAVGIVALYRYLSVNDVLGLQLVIVALGALIFGVALPAYIFKRVAEMRNSVRKQTEEMIARLISGWLENYKEADGDAIKDPIFWVNIALTAIEIFGAEAEHPAAVTLLEFIPMIKQELKKTRPKKKAKLHKVEKPEKDSD